MLFQTDWLIDYITYVLIWFNKINFFMEITKDGDKHGINEWGTHMQKN